MPIRRRFEATPETVLRDLAATLVRMGATNAAVTTGGRLSKELTRSYQRSGIALDGLVLDLVPVGAAVAFTRGDRRYRFACTKYDDQRDNLRAAQLAVSLLYRVYDEYAVSEGGEAQESFDRLFGGHLALGDGSAGWWAVLGVPRDSSPDVVKRAYHQQVRALHTDNPENRGPGAHDALVRINRAYAEAQDALGVK